MPSELKIYSDIVLFGVRIVFESNDRECLDVAIGLYSSWTASSCLEAVSEVYVVLAIGASDRADIADIESIDGAHLSIGKNGIQASGDGRAGRGRCKCTPDAVRGGMLAEILNTVVLFLVAHAGRTPLHASAVMFGECAVVLAGRSGAGKSSLALAACRANFPVLAEDTVFVQTTPVLRVWSIANAIHVLEADSRGDRPPTQRSRSGRWKNVFPIRTPRRMAERAMLCVLARGERAGLEPLRCEAAVAALISDAEPAFRYYGDRSETAIRALAAEGCWRLTLSHDPDQAIAVLRAGLGGGI